MFTDNDLTKMNHEMPMEIVIDDTVEEVSANGKDKDMVNLYKSFMRHLLGDSGSYCIAFNGPRGGGKTLSMSYIASETLDWGLPVWSNYPICGRKHPERKATLLDKKALLSMDTEMKFGFLCIDEAQFLGDSRRPGSVSNLLFGYAFMQIRKNYLSIIFTVKDMSWIDSRVRWETDLAFDCRDASKTPLGRAKKIEQGEVIYMNMRDLSGQLTGKRYDETFKIYYMTLCPGHLVWPCYDTSQQVDLMEAMAGVEMNLTKIRIGDERKEEEREAVSSAIYNALCQVKDQAKMTQIKAVDLWAHLNKAGVEGDSRQLGQYLSSLGVTKKQSSKGTYIYDLSGLDTTQDLTGSKWGGE